MPKRTDIHSILIIGSGPIVIGQACEFDYSGTQACKALKDEGYRIILVNSNPATIMTDPEFADRTYIEPLTAETLERIIEREKPDAILPTVGGQTGINLAMALYENGALARHNVELIGANAAAIKTAEDRQLFKEKMVEIGVEVPRSAYAATEEDAEAFAAHIGYPLVIRPSFTLGGSGGGIAYNIEELREVVSHGLELSPVHRVLVEESVIGWKEFELEVMRDKADNVIVVCSIENLDPMGVHTGDSITVAPQQTLTNREYQAMRDEAKRIIRAIGVETGGSNIQFAVHPTTGRRLAIEMNPRVSRSSALASKATGFPIAKFAAKLAAGYTLDEIPNDITRKTPASFEPTIDYVVVKLPRFAFEKFRHTPPTLGLSMQSVGESMAIGRTFNEALQKGLRSLEIGVSGLESRGYDRDKAEKLLRTPQPERIFAVADAFRAGMTVDEVNAISAIDCWFLREIRKIVEMEKAVSENTRLTNREPSPPRLSAGEKVPKADEGADLAQMKQGLLALKREGFSDHQIAKLANQTEEQVRKQRHALGIRPVYKRVDTCAAEFEATTPYLYSTYERECEAEPTSRRKVMILGSGPNRIGQGIEFDTCCVHASFALREIGFETIMVNCNPETVSTDYDTSDRLYFEPLTLEDVLEIVELEKPEGVIVQFGGQTPLKLAKSLAAAGVPMWGTSVESIDIAEDRERFGTLADQHEILVPEHGTGMSEAEAIEVARRIGFPVVVRPSYVLGGRAMAIVYDESNLREYIGYAMEAAPGHPILIDRFLEDAIELDVDAISDGHDVVIAGVMEHIEEAGIHSGDSTTVIPPYIIGLREQDRVRRRTVQLAKALNVIGLMNVQYAIYHGDLYVLEVNPRASRTVPYVSKATGVPFAKIAAKVMAGMSLQELGLTHEPRVVDYFVKAPVFPFGRFPREDTVLGPEMKSTGEVMGSAPTFGEAYAKALLGAGVDLPLGGTAFMSVNDNDKRPVVVQLAKDLAQLGFKVVATSGTRDFLENNGVEAGLAFKVHESERPNIVDRMINGEVTLIINTPLGKKSFYDDTYIRRTALQHGISCLTTLTAATAAVDGIRSLREGLKTITTLQEQHAR
ncbi:MAG TPA: carbamoyl-phosphate synthase large subunit [Thermoanaerobaculia bacterium]|jgi:carbamoyl-phosphate synthase large subunit|nr:carbamoyl-phosphate synthase large subunit [Thermoanaerobaculia bacterium]